MPVPSPNERRCPHLSCQAIKLSWPDIPAATNGERGNPFSPPVCPSCQGDDTMPKGLDIISQFFRYSAQPINFGDARYVRHYAICFSDVCFSGPSLANGSWGRWGRASGKAGGQVFLVAAAAVDICLLMKGALRSTPAAGVGWRLGRAVQRSSGVGERGGGTPLGCARGPAEIWEKQGTCAVCRLLHGLACCQMCGHVLRSCVFWVFLGGGNERDFQAICRQGLILSAHVRLFFNKENPMKKKSKLW